MKTAKIVLATTLLSVVCMTGTALAQTSYPPSPTSTTVVKGAGSGEGSTAFTGGDVSAIVIALAVLATLGLLAFIAARFWPERNVG
jgi:hypothetical protein